MDELIKISKNGQWSLIKSRSDLPSDYLNAIKSRAKSLTRASDVPKFANEEIRNRGLDIIKQNTHSRINPVTNEQEVLLFRGTHSHDDEHLKDGVAAHPYANTWTYKPASADAYSRSDAATRDGRKAKIISAFVPVNKIHNVLSANIEDPGHGEVIVSPLHESPIQYQQFSTSKWSGDKDSRPETTGEPFGYKVGWNSGLPNLKP